MHAPRARVEIISIILDFIVIALFRSLYFIFYEISSLIKELRLIDARSFRNIRNFFVPALIRINCCQRPPRDEPGAGSQSIKILIFIY